MIGRRSWERTSFIEDHPSEDETRFLLLVADGDTEGIKALLETSPNISVDCCDIRGQRALDIAVKKNDEELVKFLLENLTVSSVHVYSATLQAVVEDLPSIVSLLLDRLETLEVYSSHDITRDSLEFAKFYTCPPQAVSGNMTPIMAAGIYGKMEVARILLGRGYYVRKPHKPKCQCEECCANRVAMGETLSESIIRKNSYRALASPVYIILTSDDPILTSFEMSHELMKLSEAYPEYQKEYVELAAQCADFSTDILDQCRDTVEVKTVLEQKKGYTDVRSHRFSRLHLAVQYEQKKFVTHPSCQQVVRSLWTEGLPSWWSWSAQRRLLHVLTQAILTPLIAVAYVCLPRSKVIGPLCVPLNRFIHSATSYIVFLSLLLITLLYDHRNDVKSPLSWSEVAVGCWVVGHFWATMSNIYYMGVHKFTHSVWQVFDFWLFGMFLVAEILFFASYLYSKAISFNPNRRQWFWYHPFLLGEGIFAVASILAFTRVLLWYHTSPKLGPLGTTLTYMLKDITKFFLLFFIIIFAFATGINSIYKNYKHPPTPEEGINQPQAFLTLRHTFKTLFWAIFDKGDPDYADIVITGTNKTNGVAVKDHIFSEMIGYGLWGTYHLVTVVVLLNMLVAMMAETYQRIQGNAEIEWKFACLKLWLTVLHNHCLVPPPFNLIPSLNKIILLIQWTIDRIRKKEGTTRTAVSCSLKRCCYWDSSDEVDQKTQEENYQKLLVQLIRRYLRSLERQKDFSLTNIPIEVKEKLKAEIVNDLKKTLSVNAKDNKHSVA